MQKLIEKLENKFKQIELRTVSIHVSVVINNLHIKNKNYYLFFMNFSFYHCHKTLIQIRSYLL